MSETPRYPRHPLRLPYINYELSCILDSCTISASCEVSQAQKALLLMPRTAKGASTSSNELNAQVSLLTQTSPYPGVSKAKQHYAETRAPPSQEPPRSHRASRAGMTTHEVTLKLPATTIPCSNKVVRQV